MRKNITTGWPLALVLASFLVLAGFLTAAIVLIIFSVLKHGLTSIYDYLHSRAEFYRRLAERRDVLAKILATSSRESRLS